MGSGTRLTMARACACGGSPSAQCRAPRDPCQLDASCPIQHGAGGGALAPCAMPLSQFGTIAVLRVGVNRVAACTTRRPPPSPARYQAPASRGPSAGMVAAGLPFILLGNPQSVLSTPPEFLPPPWGVSASCCHPARPGCCCEASRSSTAPRSPRRWSCFECDRSSRLPRRRQWDLTEPKVRESVLSVRPTPIARGKPDCQSRGHSRSSQGATASPCAPVRP